MPFLEPLPVRSKFLVILVVILGLSNPSKQPLFVTHKWIFHMLAAYKAHMPQRAVHVFVPVMLGFFMSWAAIAVMFVMHALSV